MKSLIFVIGLIFSANAMADVNIVKAVDGSKATCTAQTPAAQAGKTPKVLSIATKTLNQYGDLQEVRFNLWMVVCNAGQWDLDMSPLAETYTLNGVEVNVQYTQFKFYVVDADSNPLVAADLTVFNKVGMESKNLMIDTSKKGLQVVVKAIKEVKASNGYEFSEPVNFGTFNLVF